MIDIIKDLSLEEAKQWSTDYMDEGLVLASSVSDALCFEEPKRLNFIVMALCRKGHAEYSIDTREQSVKPGDLFFVSERHIIDQYSSSPDFECMGILLSTEFYHGFIQNVKNISSLLLFSMDNPVVALTPREIQVYSNYYQAIREKMADTEHHYRTDLVRALLLAMFYDMSNVIWRVEHSQSKTRKRADDLFARFVRLLEENFRSERRVSWYADQLCITPKYLSEVVKSVSKRTPNEWIDNYVILEVRVQLKNTTKSIKEITKELHFPNQSFLGKYFKERTGLSPSDYRKV